MLLLNLILSASIIYHDLDLQNPSSYMYENLILSASMIYHDLELQNPSTYKNISVASMACLMKLSGHTWRTAG